MQTKQGSTTTWRFNMRVTSVFLREFNTRTLEKFHYILLIRRNRFAKSSETQYWADILRIHVQITNWCQANGSIYVSLPSCVTFEFISRRSICPFFLSKKNSRVGTVKPQMFNTACRKEHNAVLCLSLPKFPSNFRWRLPCNHNKTTTYVTVLTNAFPVYAITCCGIITEKRVDYSVKKDWQRKQRLTFCLDVVDIRSVASKFSELCQTFHFCNA